MITSNTLSISALLTATAPDVSILRIPIGARRCETYTYYPGDGRTIVWDVAAAWEVIEAAQRRPERFSPQEQGVTLNEIRRRAPDLDTAHAMTCDVTRPLIFVPMNGEFQLIDGWHRLYRALTEGVTEMRAYVLTRAEADSVRLAG